MAIRIGIDLGTTFSTVSYYDPEERRIEIIPFERLADGRTELRSVVYFPPGGGDPVIGEEAWNRLVQEPERTVDSPKRYMAEPESFHKRFKNGMDGNPVSPISVSTEILKALVSETLYQIQPEEVEGAVITVPAGFGDSERAATLEAATNAGLNVFTLLTEPQSAAIAYAIENDEFREAAQKEDRFVLVYDLGGGTFDSTLVRSAFSSIESGDHLQLEKPLALHCNRVLGGKDWDNSLAELIAEKVNAEHGTNPLDDAKGNSHLMAHSEKAKRSLTSVDSVQVVGDLQAHMVEVSRAEFDDVTVGHLFKTKALVERVLADAKSNHGVSKDQIDILLAGGSTWMPQVKEMLTEVMGGRAPLEYKKRQQMVSMGAAYVAHFYDDNAEPVKQSKDGAGITLKPTEIKNITAYGVGVEVSDPEKSLGVPTYVATVIPRGAAYEEDGGAHGVHQPGGLDRDPDQAVRVHRRPEG